MVQVKDIKDNNGNQMYTQEGHPVRQYKFESGDVFIPQISKVIERQGGKNNEGKTIINFIIPVKIKGYNDSQDDYAIIVTLTPAQAKTLQKKTDAGYDIVKYVFNAYTYYDKDNIERIGVGFKPKKSIPISFDDINHEDIEPEYINTNEDIHPDYINTED